MFVDECLVPGLDDEGWTKGRDKSPKPREQTIVVESPDTADDSQDADSWKGIVYICTPETYVEVPEYTADGHLPKPAQGEVKSEFSLDKHTDYRKDERSHCICDKYWERTFPKKLQYYDQ